MLTFNENNQAFILFTNDVERAEMAGLTLSTTARGPAGEKVYFTADHKKQPVFNPYAVLEYYDEADDACRVKLESLAQDYRKSWADDDDGEFPCPSGKEYMAYQRAGIAFAVERSHSIIGDEPGLGKTIQAVGIGNAIGARRVLIVCPASIRINWCKEIRIWSTLGKVNATAILNGKAIHLLTSGAIQNSEPDEGHYVVISYDLLRNKKIHAALRAIDWDLGVFDEAHYLKSTDAQRTRAVFGGGMPGKVDPETGETEYSFHNNGLDLNIGKMVCMTGTPLPNRPRECYTVARGLDWGAIDYLSKEAFLFRYNPSLQFGTGHTEEEKGRLPELNARLRCNLMVRRLKKDVLPQLPDKRYEMTYIEEDGAIRDVLARESLIDFDPDDLFNGDFTLDGTPISTLRREMGEAMVSRVVEYVRHMFDMVEVDKMILYGHHKSVIAELYDQLDMYSPVLHTGGLNTTRKEQSKADFINDRDCRLFIGQLDTMEGVDGLQSVCSNVVFAEPAWNPGRNEQCVDRAHRIGQHDNVIAHFLLVKGSFNEKVLNTVLNKAGDIFEALDRRVAT